MLSFFYYIKQDENPNYTELYNTYRQSFLPLSWAVLDGSVTHALKLTELCKSMAQIIVANTNACSSDKEV